MDSKLINTNNNGIIKNYFLMMKMFFLISLIFSSKTYQFKDEK